MRKLEIELTEEQYQHIMEEVRYSSSVHLQEESFGGYELCLYVSIPNIFSSLEMKMANTIDLGEVNWQFKKIPEPI